MKCVNCGKIATWFFSDGKNVCDDCVVMIKEHEDGCMFSREQADDLLKMKWVGEYPTERGYYYVYDADGDRFEIIRVDNWIYNHEHMIMFFELNTSNWLKLDCGYYKKEHWGPKVIMPTVREVEK